MSVFNINGALTGIFMAVSVAGATCAAEKNRVVRLQTTDMPKLDTSMVSVFVEGCLENKEDIEKNVFKPPFQNHRMFLIDENRRRAQRLEKSGFDPSPCR